MFHEGRSAEGGKQPSGTQPPRPAPRAAALRPGSMHSHMHSLSPPLGSASAAPRTRCPMVTVRGREMWLNIPGARAGQETNSRTSLPSTEDWLHPRAFLAPLPRLSPGARS